MTLEQAIEFCLHMKEEQYKSANNIIRGDYPEYEAAPHFRLASEYKQIADWLMEFKETKRLLKLATDTINHNLHKSCYNCSHFTFDSNCDIGKYLYGTGEKECEWEWKHMGEIINFFT